MSTQLILPKSYYVQPGLRKLEVCDEHPSVIVASAAWCGHCKRSKDFFANLHDRANFKKTYHVHILDDKAHKHIMQKLNIKSFPTLLVHHPELGRIYKYNGERNVPNMEQFMDALSSESDNTHAYDSSVLVVRRKR